MRLVLLSMLFAGFATTAGAQGYGITENDYTVVQCNVGGTTCTSDFMRNVKVVRFNGALLDANDVVAHACPRVSETEVEYMKLAGDTEIERCSIREGAKVYNQCKRKRPVTEISMHPFEQTNKGLRNMRAMVLDINYSGQHMANDVHIQAISMPTGVYNTASFQDNKLGNERERQGFTMSGDNQEDLLICANNQDAEWDLAQLYISLFYKGNGTNPRAGMIGVRRPEAVPQKPKGLSFY